jgi:hypothetical protein
MADEKSTFEGWVILELMGHRRLAGYLSEEVVGGTAFLRIDVPGVDSQVAATQFYSGSAVYCITPTTEEIARKVAASCQPAPVTAWELRPERTLAPTGIDYSHHDDEDDGDEPVL